jgi:Family of unknown function (DUF6726)
LIDRIDDSAVAADGVGRMTAAKLLLGMLCVCQLGGCAVVAAPFHVAADVVRVVPVVGDAIAVPFDAVGDVID